MVALIAGFVPSDYLWDTVSIGTLVAFSVVAIGVMVLRRTMPDLHRPFRVPLFPITPILTVAACVYVLSGLAAITWVIFGVWLAIVLAYYFFVGRHRSRLNDDAGRGRPPMTLLVGFPAGHEDRSGLELAATLARSSGQDLALVTVVPAPGRRRSPDTPTASSRTGRRRGAATAVEAAEALLADHCPDLPRDGDLGPGRSAPGTLVTEAERIGASMIVVGAGHDGGYGRVVLGSTAHRLLHSSTVPVAVATRGYRASDHGKVVRATCAFRGDEASRRTLARTAEICREVGAGLRIATFAVRGRTMYPPEVATDLRGRRPGGLGRAGRGDAERRRRRARRRGPAARSHDAGGRRRPQLGARARRTAPGSATRSSWSARPRPA